VRLHNISYFEITLKIYIVWLQFEEEARKTLSAGRGLPVAESAPPLCKEKNQEITTTYEKGSKSIKRYSYVKKIIMIDLPIRYS